jgi:formyl-CoA transferase/CoA:oxalate CoA-transferase
MSLADGPLQGVTVLDLTRVLSGPYCTMLLADMGARVIKIEQPGRGDQTRAWGPPFVSGESAYFLSINRNKESVTLDFTRPAARAVLERLTAKADILVENFRPGTLARIGFDYESLRARYPRLVYCSISGFGQSGPRRGEAGYDAVVQAEGGLMSVTGEPQGAPVRVGVAVADLVAGLFAAQGILLALFARQHTQCGQLVDVSLLDTVAALMSYHAESYLAAGEVAQRLGNQHPSIAPYDTFDTQNGPLVLAIGNDDQFRRFCEVALPSLATDPRFSTNPTRVEHYGELRSAVADRLRQQPREEWITRLRAVGVPCGSIRTIAEALADPQLDAREMIAAVEHTTAGRLQVLGVPIKLSATPGSVRTAPPTLGQHTESVLRDDLGLDADAIAHLRAAQAI